MTPEARRGLEFASAAGLCALTVWVLGQVAPRVALDEVLAFALAYLAVAGEILLLSLRAPRLSRRTMIIACALALAGVFALSGVRTTPGSAALLSLALGVATVLAGAALGASLQRPGHLVAVGLISALADLWSVFDPTAPSARIAEQALAQPDRLSPFALPFPLLGTELIPAIIGAGDVLFTALYVAAYRAHGLSLLRLAVALALAYALGLAGLLIWLVPLPLLPLLSLAAVLPEPAAHRLTPREWRTVLAAGGLLTVAIAARALR